MPQSRATPVRVMGLSLAGGLIIGLIIGAVYALLGGRDLVYAVGTVWLIVGVLALGMGLMGALEPPEGWASRRRGRGWDEETAGRASLLGRVATEATDDKVSSIALAIWAVLAGGGLISAGLLALQFAGR